MVRASISNTDKSLTKRRQSRRSSNGIDVDVKQITKSQKEIIQTSAFNELLALNTNDSGCLEIQPGTIEKIVQTYSVQGYSKYVTRSNLRYRMELYKKGLRMRHERPTDIIFVTKEEDDNISSLEIPVADFPPISANDSCSSHSTTTSAAKEQEAIRCCMIVATKGYLDFKKYFEGKGSQLPKSSLQLITESLEEKYFFKFSESNIKTIKSRIKSPLAEIEPFIAEWCTEKSNMGGVYTKSDVMKLANELIEGTETEKALVEYKQKRRLKTTDQNGKVMLGDAWYKGFIKRYSKV